MARLYTNENFPQQSVDALRALGHDVLTTHAAGNSNAGIPDDEVVRFASANDRIVVTLNRRDFLQLHAGDANHAGIVVCTVDLDFVRLAARVDSALAAQPSMAGELVRINRGSTQRPGCAARVGRASSSGSSDR